MTARARSLYRHLLRQITFLPECVTGVVAVEMGCGWGRQRPSRAKVFFFFHFTRSIHTRSIHTHHRPARPYYRAHLREGFASFTDEADSGRLAQIEARALQDAAWVVAKVRTVLKRVLVGRAGALEKRTNGFTWARALNTPHGQT
jgi:hypothetical protein